MKKILLFSLIAILVASILTGVVFFSLCHQDKRALDTIAEESGTKNFILAGLDDAGDNTDMLMLVSIGGRTGGLSFMQIPEIPICVWMAERGRSISFIIIILPNTGQKMRQIIFWMLFQLPCLCRYTGT